MQLKKNQQLIMAKPLLFLTGLLCIILCSCHNNGSETTTALLKQPPYNKLTDSIKNDPANMDLYYKRGALLFQNNQLNAAEQDLKKAWNTAPKEAYAVRLSDILAKKNLDSAITFLQQALIILPQSVALQVSLAKQFHNHKENDKALTLCRQIVSKYPNQIDALELEAQILVEQNKQNEAIIILEKAYSYAPFDIDLCNNLAFIYAQNKNPKALVLADSLLNMDSAKTHAEPYYFKALYYENTGSLTTAKQYLNLAIQHDYYFLDAYMEKGQILYNQKNYDGALKTFSLAATVSPTFADAYYWMGRCQQATNHYAEAKQNYLQAYGLDPSLKDAKEAADKL